MKLAAAGTHPALGAALAVPSRRDLADLLGRATIVSLFTMMAVRLGLDWAF